jgi:FSR family fosmidomycin resistance protein-like MFS transporter
MIASDLPGASLSLEGEVGPAFLFPPMKATTMADKIKANVKVLFALTLVHFAGDFYSSFTTPLFPLFVDKLGLSLTQVGVIAGINRLLAFIVQPSVGYLADRSPTRRFILTGLLMAVVFIPLSGMAVGFWSLLIPVAVGSFGSSMFHPSVTGMVPLYAGRKAGFAMSVFNTGGTLAFAAGPLFITWYADRFGLNALPLTMVFGVGVVIYICFTLPVPQSEGLSDLGFFGSLKASLMMGFAYGLGGAITPLVGRMADLYSIHTVLTAMAGLAVVTVPIILLFPKIKN